MNKAPPLPNSAGPAAGDPAPDRMENCASLSDESPAERVARHLRMMKTLGEFGMDVARTTRDRAVAQAAAAEEVAWSGAAAPDGAAKPVDGEVELAFTRVATIVRRIVVLEIEIAAGRLPREARPAGEPAPPPAERSRRTAAAPAEAKPSKKGLVRSLVENSILMDVEEEAEQEELAAALDERLGDDEDWARYGDRGDGDIADEIIRDLGFPSPFVHGYRTQVFLDFVAARTLNPKYAARRIAAVAAGLVPELPQRRDAPGSGNDPP